MAHLTRRAALLGGAGALGACDTIEDLLRERKRPLPGQRVAVLQNDQQQLAADTADTVPVSLPPPTPIADWPQAGGNLGHAPGHGALSGNLAEAWRASVGAGTGYRQRQVAGPIIADGTVYTADADGRISAFDLARGGRRWAFDSTPAKDSAGHVGAGCAFDSGTLYVATGLAEVLALDPANGQPRWRVRLPAPARGAPTVAGGRIFVVTVENQLLALATEDGKRQWTHRGVAAPAVPLGLASPALDGETLVAGLPSGELLALRATDGRVLWTESLGTQGSGGGGLADLVGIRALPVIDRGRVFAVGLGGISVGVDLRSGRRLWERDIGGNETPVVAGDWVFVVSDAGQLAAITREEGRIRWLVTLNPPPPPGQTRSRDATVRFATPLLAGGRLILPGTGSEALLLDPAEGQVVARLRLPGAVSLPPAMAGETVVMQTDDGTVVAFRGA